MGQDPSKWPRRPVHFGVQARISACGDDFDKLPWKPPAGQVVRKTNARLVFKILGLGQISIRTAIGVRTTAQNRAMLGPISIQTTTGGETG